MAANVEPIDPIRIPGTDIHLAPLVKAGPWVFLNGIEAVDYAVGLHPGVAGNPELPYHGLPKTRREGDFICARLKELLEKAGTSFANVAAFNGTSTSTPWGTFRALSPAANGSFLNRTITSNGIAFTNSSSQFHIQPSANSGCRIPSGPAGTCYDDGNGATEMATVDSNLRFNAPATFQNLTTQPSVKRVNLFANGHFDLTDNLTLYGEAGFYRGKTQATIGAPGSLANIPITVAANAYWNPLGPVGSPNRLPGLNTAVVPASGLPVQITSLSYVDFGSRKVDVTNYQYRVLGGLKGNIGNWDWDSAALYTWATAADTQENFTNS